MESPASRSRVVRFTGAAWAALLVACLSVLVSSGCDDIGSAGDARTDASLVSKRTSRTLTAQPSTLNLGRVDRGETAEGRVILKNNDNSAVRIERIATSCGCATARLSGSEIAAGESAELLVQVTPRSRDVGTLRHSIRVIVEGQEEPLVLSVLAETESGSAGLNSTLAKQTMKHRTDPQPALQIRPRRANLGEVRPDRPIALTLTLLGRSTADELSALRVETDDPAWRAHVESIDSHDSSASIQVQLLCNDSSAGPFRGALRFTLGQHEGSVEIACIVAAPRSDRGLEPEGDVVSNEILP